MEIGSYCGKSAVFIGEACKKNNAVLFSLDHHRGSEEQQPGQEYFDPDFLDDQTGLIDTLPFFRRTLLDFGLEDTVIPIIGHSETVGRNWQTPLGLLFTLLKFIQTKIFFSPEIRQIENRQNKN